MPLPQAGHHCSDRLNVNSPAAKPTSSATTATTTSGQFTLHLLGMQARERPSRGRQPGRSRARGSGTRDRRPDECRPRGISPPQATARTASTSRGSPVCAPHSHRWPMNLRRVGRIPGRARIRAMYVGRRCATAFDARSDRRAVRGTPVAGPTCGARMTTASVSLPAAAQPSAEARAVGRRSGMRTLIRATVRPLQLRDGPGLRPTRAGEIHTPVGPDHPENIFSATPCHSRLAMSMF